MAVLSQNALLDPRLMNLHHESDRWVANGVVETGGGALRWFRDQCCYADVLNAEKTGQGAFEIIIDDAAEVSPGSDGVSFFPYLLGERLMGSPYSRGVFFGLHQRTDRSTMVRAILEGIKFELRRTLEIVEQTGITANQIRATGGGAQNDVWNQVRADIDNKPVVTLAGEGAAWLELRSWPGWLLDYGLTPLPPGAT